MFISTSCSSNSVLQDKEEEILLRIQIGEKYGFINKEGKVVIEPQFDGATITFTNDLCFVREGSKRGFINKKGEYAIELGDSIEWVSPFIKDVAVVEISGNRYNIINKDGSLLFRESKPNKIEINVDNDSVYFYTQISSNKNHTIEPQQLNRWHIYNSNGYKIGESYDEIGKFSEGLCAININGKWGFINKEGKFVIDTLYNEVRSFSPEGLAVVKTNTEEFFINKQGLKEIPTKSIKILTDFHSNRAGIEINGEKFLINREGKKIKKLNIDTIYNFDDKTKLATIINDGKAAKIDTTGNIILQTHYDKLSKFINDLAIVIENDKIGIIDKNGIEIINRNYDSMGRLTYDDYGLSEDIPIIALVNKNKNNNLNSFYFFDMEGNLIGKDIPLEKPFIPNNPSKEDFINFFDSRLSELDPIEGVYFVTVEDYYQNRTNPDIIGLNKSKSDFFAIVKDERNGDFNVYLADGSNHWWVNKFVKIGGTNNYAIVSNELVVNKNENKYSSEGRFTLDDPYKFNFRLEQDHNSSYNFFVTYEFVKDYPQVAEYEKIQKAEWTGSGFAIADGYVVTNYHVTSGAKNIKIKGIGGDLKKSYKAVVVAYDKDNDISILKIIDKNFDGMGTIPYKIGKTMVDVGENIFVLGYPKVDTMGEEIKVTEGIISSSSGFQGNSAMYQISAAVQPGNSGGPLFDDEGTIIGIVCAKHADAENANYAVKIANLFSLINSSNLGIKVADNNVGEKKVSSIVKKVKNYVYLIECNSR